MTRLVQIRRGNERRVALAEEPHLRLLANFTSIYELANSGLATNVPLAALIQRSATGEQLDDRMADEPERQPVRDGVTQGTPDQRQKRRHGFRVIAPLNLRDVLHH